MVSFLPIASEKFHDGRRLNRKEQMTAIAIVTCISKMSLPPNGWTEHDSSPFSHGGTVLTIMMEHEWLGPTSRMAPERTSSHAHTVHLNPGLSRVMHGNPSDTLVRVSWRLRNCDCIRESITMGSHSIWKRTG
jgi:hypothetical protein